MGVDAFPNDMVPRLGNMRFQRRVSEAHLVGEVEINGLLRAGLNAREAVPAVFRVFEVGLIGQRIFNDQIAGAHPDTGGLGGAVTAVTDIWIDEYGH